MQTRLRDQKKLQEKLRKKQQHLQKQTKKVNHKVTKATSNKEEKIQLLLYQLKQEKHRTRQHKRKYQQTQSLLNHTHLAKPIPILANLSKQRSIPDHSTYIFITHPQHFSQKALRNIQNKVLLSTKPFPKPINILHPCFTINQDHIFKQIPSHILIKPDTLQKITSKVEIEKIIKNHQQRSKKF